MSSDKGAESYLHDVYGTSYPYIQLKKGFFNDTMTNLRRSMSGFNPFANNQIASQSRMGIGPRFGNTWFKPDPLPNHVHFETLFPTHYDPTKKDSYETPNFLIQTQSPADRGSYVISADKLPRGCVRTIQTLRRCLMINGGDKCEEEAYNITRICPNWALEDMREKDRFLAKVRAIQNNQYHNVMRVSHYNEGRTIADTADRTWTDGTRGHLRPDTMWPDERYTKITQKEIDEAKERVRQRAEKKKHEHHAEHGHHAHDDKHHAEHHGDEHHGDPGQVSLLRPKRLYP
mmetsp:Transcript_66274/g.76910  ORF Transcript_66274/g.76910 Transcript_66274/m.76910 type:complete len:288 (+) Transcript_66274:59-922(+)